ncbi:Lrp/AsnC family transcriptional regulator [Bacillus sp. 31A1R]|uniref:Lrp/AsnC family transcriptional regulator n=1 Tax=Robertmurraya mangrovi TaxID=3098077 RepID=A0ABU5J2I4_9BACI|nr:Lrp/AsnC family transcriptional regulator [Bacillus sp. 31A1R]MDZ5473616.1 Lrp/AsnC family transcriptional regulator [Bacillus sp. 31A1R]
MIIDEIDKSILKELIQDGRQSMRELAKKVNLSAPSVTERVRKLESEGVIKGYSVEIDYGKLGLGIECFVEVTLRQGEYEKFRKKIADHPHAEFCYRIAGQACYIVKLRLKNFQQIEGFINEITSYAGTVTHIALSEIKTNSIFIDIE